MKLFAHRGWCAGAEENTLAAFTRAAGQAGISGIELDVRRAAGGDTLLVCHDPPPPGATTLTLDAALEFLSGTNLELFVELKEPDLAPMVIDRLVAVKMGERSVVFAFPSVARALPWTHARMVRLGIIEVFPCEEGDGVDVVIQSPARHVLRAVLDQPHQQQRHGGLATGAAQGGERLEVSPRFLVEQPPRLSAVGCADDFVSPVLQGKLKDLD